MGFYNDTIRVVLIRVPFRVFVLIRVPCCFGDLSRDPN